VNVVADARGGGESRIGTRRRVAVITGSSSGFGMFGAVELARAGFFVYATMRSPDKRDRLDEEAARAGVSVEVLPLDVTRDESVAGAFERIRAETNGVDVLVSNAGYGIGGFVEDLTIDEIRDQLETNFFGAVRVVKAALPGMRERRRGRIILVSSIGVFNPVPGLSAYNASKAALEAFARALRYEAGLDGVFVSILDPGTYPTEIFYGNRRMAAASEDPSSSHYEGKRRLEAIVMRRVDRSSADPREVARAFRRAATAPRPRVRYLVGRDTWPTRIVRTVVPDRAVQSVVRRLMGES
jgi:NAD(P)-dependent dehydrogenase (short-subunit alcohol dehydrogenase family)